jgi:uncharacterized protein YndB with AHSA1/START domain
MMSSLFLISSVLFAADASAPEAIEVEVVVNAPAFEAWARWTTNEGVQRFFPGASNGTNIELRPDGPYEFFFLPENPAGSRGCDGCRILGWQEGKMLSFTWANRPDMAMRPYRTHVTLRFEALARDKTRVRLAQDGWGEGEDWRVARDYFASAWARVLEAYRDSFEESAGQP